MNRNSIVNHVTEHTPWTIGRAHPRWRRSFLGVSRRVPCVAGAAAWSASITFLPSTFSSSTSPTQQLSQVKQQQEREQHLSPWPPSPSPTRSLPQPKTPRTLGKQCKVKHWAVQCSIVSLVLLLFPSYCSRNWNWNVLAVWELGREVTVDSLIKNRAASRHGK